MYVDENKRERRIATLLLPNTADWVAQRIVTETEISSKAHLQTVFQPRVDIQSAGGAATSKKLLALIGNRIEEHDHKLEPITTPCSNKTFQFTVIKV